MKTLLASMLLAGLAVPALAGETVTPMDDPSLDLRPGLGKQVNIRFAQGFATGRLDRRDFDGVVLTDIPDGKVCISGRDQGLDPQDERLKDVARPGEGDICAPRAEISVRVSAPGAAGAAPVPYYQTDASKCHWTWLDGQGIALWAEDCSYETGHWFVRYDAAQDLFAYGVDNEEPYPVLRQFHLAPGAGLEALLPELKAKGLILDSPDCVFAPSTEQPVPARWNAFEVVPVGKLKQAFEAQPTDEVPEPPCGEIGMVVDSVGFFMVHPDHPDRVLYVNLGQDGTQIAPETITLD